MEKSKRVAIEIAYMVTKEPALDIAKRVAPVDMAIFERIKNEQDIADCVDLIGASVVVFYKVTQCIRHLGLPYFAEPETRMLVKENMRGEIIYLLNFLEK